MQQPKVTIGEFQPFGDHHTAAELGGSAVTMACEVFPVDERNWVLSHSVICGSVLEHLAPHMLKTDPDVGLIMIGPGGALALKGSRDGKHLAAAKQLWRDLSGEAAVTVFLQTARVNSSPDGTTSGN